MVDTRGLFEFQEGPNNFNDDFDDFDATPCPEDWDRFMRQSSFPFDKNTVQSLSHNGPAYSQTQF
jgi:hypothetical protein